MYKEMPHTRGIVEPNNVFKIRPVLRVLNYSNATNLPAPCFRWTGSGDRPCELPNAPLHYGLVPWMWPRTSPIIFLRYWSWSLGDSSNPYVYSTSVPRAYTFRDHSWVEVARYAERTSYVGSDGAGYGIWYWVMPGSGVRVNIGRAVRFSNKIDAIDWSRAVAGGEQINCTSTGMASCTEHDDTYFCKAARMQGFNSVLTKRYMEKLSHLSGLRSDMIELIICPEAEPPEQTTACPAMLDYQTSSGGPCTCNPDGELLSCVESGDSGFMKLSDSYGVRPVTTLSIFAITNVGVGLVLVYTCVVVWMGRRRAVRAAAAFNLQKRGGEDEERDEERDEQAPLVQQVPSTTGMFVSKLV